jgi:Mg-chelatase subunit ChlD
MDEQLQKWRLILGKKADPQADLPLEGQLKGMDNVLDALYDSERKGGLGKSAPNVNRWLGDIRTYFPSSVVQLLQKDALDRLGLSELLLEPELLETIEMDVDLVGTILSLNKVMPTKTRETARQVVRKVVEQLERRLQNPMREAIQGSLARNVRNRRPKLNEIDWNRTIRANLKHYQKDYKTIIPEQLIGYGRKSQQLRHIILLIDQSGSMANSLVYASVLGAILASLRSVKTNMVVFDTAVADLTDHLQDPVDLLFATQLGGGTDIGKALGYAQQLVQTPTETILVLISDLFEGGMKATMLQRAAALQASGVQTIALLALDDKGAPSYDREIAGAMGELDIPAFACTPDLFPELMSAAIRKEDIRQWTAQHQIIVKN